jgi:hypothetical protein
MIPMHQDARGWELHHTDYRATLTHVAALGGADLIAFSPPYCDARSYGMGVSWGDADYAELGDAVFAALKPGGHALVNVDAPVRIWRFGFGTERGFHPWRLMLDWAERVGFRVPDRLVFGRRGMPGDYRGRFRNDWEPLLWFQRPGAPGFFDRQPLAVTTAPYVGAAASMREHGGRVRHRAASGHAAEQGLTHRGTLWNYGVAGNGQTGCAALEAAGHPARWPYRLAHDIVRCFSPVRGLVCDPFVGAGTTALAAIREGRRFIGGDSGARDDVPWVTIAHKMLTDEMSQQTLILESTP